MGRRAFSQIEFMLFTDGNWISASDLEIIDGEFTKVAAAEGILIDSSPQSIITSSIYAAGSYFTARIQNFSGYLVGVGVNSNHMAAVLNVLSTAINRPRALLHQIPVIEPDPTRTAFIRWVKYYILANFYQAAFARKLADRFEKKMLWYDQQRNVYWETLKGNGFPVTMIPLAAPGATMEYAAGTWSAANITTTAAAFASSPNTYDISITWVSEPAYQGPTNQNQGESAGSAVISKAVLVNQVPLVSIVGLNPPNGRMPVAIGSAAGIYGPMGATGWNIYANAYPSNGVLFLQNSTPIPIDTLSYQLADTPVLSGSRQNAGQPAMYDFSLPNIMWRG